jgi:acyl-CoA thioesterase FadM
MIYSRYVHFADLSWGWGAQGHVNNVNYYRYAESARVNWITNFAVHVDPAHREQWRELMSPKATGLIMRSLKADFKFVCNPQANLFLPFQWVPRPTYMVLTCARG